MKTEIALDQLTIEELRKLTGLATEEEIVGRALAKLLQIERQAEIKDYFGKLHWEGDLEGMRLDKVSE